MKKLVFLILALTGILLGNAQSVTITQPNGSELLYGCQTYQIKWNATGVSNSWNLDYSLNSGAIWTSVASNLAISPVSGVYTYSWTVPMVSSSSVLVRVRDYNDTLKQDVSNAVFTVQLPITITSPNGGEVWQGLSNQTISWVPAGTSGVFNLSYSINNGSSWNTIINGISANNYLWTVPNNPSTQALVRVADATTSCQVDISNAVFEMSAATPILTAPNGGEVWNINSNQNITWNTATFHSTVKLEYSTDNGVNYNLITSNAPNTGSYTWTIPNTPSTQVKVRASNTSGSTVFDISNANFTIRQPTNFITAPNGGEQWRAYNTYDITWNANFISDVKIEYSANNGSTWNTIIGSTANTGTYSWTVPLNITDQALVRITNNTVTTIVDTSNAVFSITRPVTVTGPASVTSCAATTITTTRPTSYSSTTYQWYIYYSIDGGTTFNLINTYTNSGTTPQNFTWTPSALVSNQLRYKAELRTSGGALVFADSSTTNNTIGLPSGTITVTNPNGGVSVNAASQYNIGWTASGSSGFFDIYYSTTGGFGGLSTIATNVSGNTYTWTVPNVPTTRWFVRVVDNQNACRFDTSNAANTIIAATPVLTSPNGGEVWNVNTTQNITWTASTIYSSTVKLEFSTDNGATWNDIITSTTNNGTYAWTIPNLQTTQALVRVSAIGSVAVSDVSNATFSILLPTPIITAPNGGEQWRAYNTYDITWNTASVASNVKIEYSANNGSTWNTIIASTANTGTYSWTVPLNVTDQALVRLTNVSFPTAMDTSNAVFSITRPVTVSGPANVTSCANTTITTTRPTSYSSTSYQWYLYYSIDGGTTFNLINTYTNSGTTPQNFTWTPSALVSNQLRYKAELRTSGGVLVFADSSTTNNTIGLPSGTITVNNPNGGVSVNAATTYNIGWTASGTSGFFDVYYTTAGGFGGLSTIATNVSGNSYTWTVPNVPTTRMFIKVFDSQNACRFDTSNAANTIIAATPVLTSPNGGEVWNVNTQQNITWTPSTIYSTNVKLEFSIDNGASWNDIITATTNNGSYTWTIPNLQTTQALVRISAIGSVAVSDVSNATFSILLPTPIITAPNGGEQWRAYNAYDITWNTASVASNVKIEYSANNGSTWNTIIASTANTGTYSWTVPLNVTDQALVRLTNVSFPTAMDTSNAVFSITRPVTVSGPATVTSCANTTITTTRPTSYSSTTYQWYIYYSLDGGTTFNLINTYTNSGTTPQNFTWTPSALVSNQLRYKAELRTSGGALVFADSSTTNNTIGLPSGTITVNNPNGGVTVNAASTYNVSWTASGTSGFFDVYYTTAGGFGGLSTIATNVSGNNYTWTVPNIPTTRMFIKVFDSQNACRFDTSDAANTIIAATPILTSPNGGEVWNVNTNQLITWNAASVYSSNVKLEYSIDNGINWNNITAATTNNGTYTWPVPFSTTTQALVRISAIGTVPVFDVSNATFTIQYPTPVVTAPNGGETWYAGTTQNITWLPSTYFSATVNLEYSLDSGSTWVTIANNQTNSGSYTWTLPNVNSTRALVKVSNSTNTAYYDVSNALLTLRPYVRIVSPNGGNVLGACTQTTITFEKAPLYTAFNMEYSTDNGATWTAIFTNQTYSSTVNTYNWTVPNTPSTQTLIRVYPYNVLSRADTTDAVFTIRRAVTIIQPNFGGVLVVGSSYPVKWQSDGISNIYDLAYSTAGPNGPWTNIALGYNTSTNTYNWTVPNTPSTNCYLRIRDNINSCKEDISDLAFTISTTANPITLTAPNGTDSLSACQAYNVTWTEVGGPIGSYNIAYSIDNGTNWIPVATSYATTSYTYPWIVPNINAPAVLVRVQSGLNPLVFDYSDALFKIIPGRLVTNNDTTICSGNSVQLNTTGGSTYSWNPTTGLSNPTIANPLATPSATTQYVVSSVNGGCSLSDTVFITVNPSSGASASVIIAPTPGTAICSGTNVLFTATPTNGGFSPVYQWKVNNNNVGTNTYTYSSNTLANGDVVKVVMTSSQQCVQNPVATSNIVNMTVFPNVTPSVTISTAQTTICAGSNVTFTASPTNGGGAPVYQWKKNGNNVGTNANTYTDNALSNNDVISVDLTSNANCASPTQVSSNSILMTVNPNNTPAVTITASTNNICTGTSVQFTANATNAGTTPVYQWKKNGNNVGTGLSTYTTTTLANNDVITCEVTSNAPCNTISTVTSNAITMSVSSSVTPAVSIVATNNNVCAGTQVTFTATPVNGGGTPAYQWKVNGINAGTNSNTYATSALNNSDSVWVVMTSSSGCASPTTATSNKVTMTVNPTSAPTVSVAASATTLCAGTNVTFTATATNAGSTPAYQWKLNGSNVGGNAATYNTSALATNDSVWVVVTSSSSCATPNTSTSNKVTVTVNPVVTPSLAISTTSNNVCANTQVLFTAVATNGGSNPTYQWKLNGGNVGANSTTYSSTTLANGDVVTCVLTSNVACATTTTATSNAVTMTISANTSPSVTISTPATTVCSGTPVTFTANATNAGGSPVYQWKLNGGNVGNNSSTYTNATLANNDAVSIVVTSSAACANPTTATSNTVQMTVNTTVTPSVTVSASATSICAGQSVTFTATPVNGGTTPVYQWKKNGGNVGTNSPTFTTTALANNDVITVEMTGNATCASTTTVTSNAVTITVNSAVTPTVSITSSATSICGGTSVTFNSTVTNGGGTPTYVWRKNGNVINGATSSSYTTTTLTNADVITLDVTSSAACPSPATVSSNSITMIVTPSVTASVAISASTTNICTGASVTFTATPTNGGSTPVYQWKVNGGNVGTNSTTYTTTTLANNDMVSCVMTSNATCVATAQVTSNTISMIVNTPAAATVTISGGNSICAGAQATFTSNVTNAGSSPVYQWKVNGNNSGTNSATFSTTTLANGDVVSLTFTSVNGCSGTNSANSNTITMTVAPSVAPDVTVVASSTSICAGQNVTFTATPVNGGGSPTYQWFKNGTVVGTNSNTYASTALANGDVVKAVLTSSATCAVPATDTSNAVIITVGSNATPTVSIAASATTICTGNAVTFTATPVNGGTTPSYQWKVNTTNVGTNSATFTSSSLVNGDVVTVIMTSNANCVSTTTATSNAVTILVTAPVTPAVTFTSSATSICAGQNVTFTASPTNGGNTPAYQWKLNGGNVGTNSATYSSTTLANGDQVTVVMTSSATCPSVPTATATPVTITVNPSVTPDVTIAASATAICSGSPVVFTATATGGGNTPTYQWLRNNTVVGTNSATLNTSSLSNGDVVTCVLTTSASCYTQQKDTSNAVTITVNTSVTPSVSITASTTTICAGGSVTFTATPVNGGNSPVYQWKVNNNNAGVNSATFTSTTLANGDVVTVQLTSNAACASPATVTSNAVTMLVSTAVTPAVTVNASATTICNGNSVTFTATPTNGGSTPAYQWKLNGNNVGTNSATYSSATLANGDQVSVILTSSASCTTVPTATATPVTITVNTASAPSVSITESVNSICSGVPVTFTATPVNGGNSPDYQWKVNGNNAGNNSASFVSTTLNSGDVVTVVLTSSSTCATPNTATSNAITMSVTPNVTPTISISSNGSLCAGNIATFTATIVNGGSAPAYQWKLNGNNVGSGISTYSSSSLANGDVVTCELTSNANCAAPTVVGSNQITVSISPNVTPAVSITASSTVVCGGNTVTFNATPVNGGNSPAYQWLVNGNNVGTNSNVYSSSSLSSGDVVSVELTSNAACAAPATTVSNAVTMQVGNTVTPSVSVSASATNICSGTSVTFTATPVNGGTTPAYAWTVNNIAAGTNSATFTTNTLNNNDVVKVTLTSSEACAQPATATSATVTITVNSVAQPSANITVSQNPVCSGTSVTFTATASNAGGNPLYGWKLNGNSVGVNSSTYTLAAPANGDQVLCEVTSTSQCANGTIAGSNTVTMQVGATLTPSVSVSASATTFCSGTSVTFTATPVNGGNNPTYVWKVNGNTVGNNSATFVSTTLANNDAVTVEMTSDLDCATGGAVAATPVTVTVTTSVTPTVAVAVSPSNEICANTNVVFTATPVNGGTTPAYQWKLNGNNVGTNDAVYSNAALTDGDVVTVELTSNAGCATQPAVLATPTTITVHALPAAPTIAQSGNTLTSSAVSGNQWLQNNSPISGATQQTYTVVTSGWYAVEATNSNGCSSKSDSMFVTVTGIEEVTVTEAVQILPNPFYQNFSVKVANSVRNIHDWSLTITDELGRTVYGTNNVQYINLIDLGGHAAGVYFVTVNTGTQHHTFKVVKQE
jgi:hypothetical protein